MKAGGDASSEEHSMNSSTVCTVPADKREIGCESAAIYNHLQKSP